MTDLMGGPQYHPSRLYLSRIILVTSSDSALARLEWMENTVPPIGEVEVRHLENQHWIMPSPVAATAFIAQAKRNQRFSKPP